ncbi:NAD(P)/FAD-dependent oxidoreductase [Dongia sp.]|uniref:FAD/NAD(P)-dependent oxidoreductase n=1 Tax=Dongia sp. TaxID=1977262 RepID=UPI0035AFBF5B
MSALDLLIIGGGAAGLSAAASARKFGLAVALVDERPAPGGNFYAGIAGPKTDAVFAADHARGAALLARARAAVIDSATTAWRVDRDGQCFVLGATGTTRRIIAKRILVATGAMERPVPIPGSTLPGVMYAGAAQVMLKSAALVPSGRVVLVGSGPLLLLVAKQLAALGAPPVAVVETTPPMGLGATLRQLPAAMNAPAMLVKGIGLQRAIGKAGIRRYRQAVGVSVAGDVYAEGVSFSDAQGRHDIAADLVLLHDGVIPNDHVTRQLGCAAVWNASQHAFAPVVDRWGETSLAGFFAAGDCTGIWGAQAAELSGEIAALEIARQLGFLTKGERDQRARRPLRQLRRQRAFRPFLEARFPPVLSRAASAADNTVICRCENVTTGEIRLAVAQGATGPSQLKSFTRCGMGPCQGRSCAMAAAEIMATALGRSIAEIGRHDIRAPLKPIPLGRVAAALEAAE